MPDVARTVGRYEVLGRIGSGGMAVVYLARQPELDRLVALKQLKLVDEDDPSYAQRFLRESRMAGSLSHPNIVTVFDYFEHQGTPYIAMEYVRGGSLRPHVGDLTLPQIAGVFEGLLAGLAHGEAQGIVHRDLKPENVMVTGDGRVKIADYGIAKATTELQTGAFKTRTGTTIGTPHYMAPEQAMAEKVGPWTDLYAVGCMAFELFAGRVPFHDTAEPMAIMLRQIGEAIPAVRTIRPEVDQGISDWIEALLAKDIAARTQSAHDAWDQFEEIVIGLLGPRWRRQAQLRDRATPPPQPVGGTPEPEVGRPSRPYTPPPRDLPPGPLRPSQTRVPDAPPPEYGAPPPGPATPAAEPGPPPPGAATPAAEPGPPPPGAATPAAEPEPPPTTAPRSVRTRPRRAPVAAAAIAGAVVLLGALGFLLAPAEETPAELSLDEAVSGRNLSYRVPAGWRVADPGPAVEIPGLRLQGPVVAQPPGAARAEAVQAGFTSTTDASLLPASFARAVREEGARPAAVRLPAGIAYRYDGIRPGGSGPPVTVVALPTSRGVATLACRGAAGSSVGRTCDAIARTLEPAGGRVYSPPPRTEFATALNRIMGRVSADEARAAPILRRLRRPRGIAAAVQRLGETYAAAARDVGRIDAAPFERARTGALERHLRRLGEVHAEMSAAAAGRNRARYRTARSEASALRARLGSRLRAMRSLGYDVTTRGAS